MFKLAITTALFTLAFSQFAQASWISVGDQKKIFEKVAPRIGMCNGRDDWGNCSERQAEARAASAAYVAAIEFMANDSSATCEYVPSNSLAHRVAGVKNVVSCTNPSGQKIALPALSKKQLEALDKYMPAQVVTGNDRAAMGSKAEAYTSANESTGASSCGCPSSTPTPTTAVTTPASTTSSNNTPAEPTKVAPNERTRGTITFDGNAVK